MATKHVRVGSAAPLGFSKFLVLRTRSDEMQALREQVSVASRYVSQQPPPHPVRSSPTRAPRANVPQSRVLNTLAAINMGASPAEARLCVRQRLSHISTIDGVACILGHIRCSFPIMLGDSRRPVSILLLFLPLREVLRLCQLHRPWNPYQCRLQHWEIQRAHVSPPPFRLELELQCI